jgi:hypothetical protein
MSERTPPAVERSVVDWLVEDGPVEAPDHLVESILAAVPRVSRVPHRGAAVLRAVLVAAAAVIVAIVVVAGIAGLRGRDVGPPAPTVPAPSGPSVIASPDVCPPAEIACGRSLAAGVAYAPNLVPRVTLSVPDGNWLAAADEPDRLLLWTTADNRRRVGLYRDPRALEPDGMEAAGVGESIPELLAWLEGHPELVVGTPVPVELAGLEGQAIDLALQSGATERTEACAEFHEAECFPLFAGATYELGVTVLSHFRLLFFDLPDGGVLLVTIEAHHDVDLDAFAERASPILESIRLVN